MHSIILIGYRGTGKTTVARSLSRRLGIPSLDCDTEIERRAGKAITEIFGQDGESAFRALEAALIADMLDKAEEPIILSTGGGAVLNPETRRKLRGAGHVVWLTASAETILVRLQGDASTATKRPGLTALPPLTEIQTMLDRRYALYAETAQATVSTDGRSLDEIVDEIINRCLPESLMT